MVCRRGRENETDRSIARRPFRPSVRPSRRSNDAHRAEQRVHRCRVSNIDRTGMHYGVTQEEAAVTMGVAAAPGMAGIRNPVRSGFITGLNRKAVYDSMGDESSLALSRLVSRAGASLSISALHLSLRSPFLFPVPRPFSRCDRLLLPSPSSCIRPLLAYLSFTALTLCQLRTDYRRFTLDRQPFLCLPNLTLFPLTRAVNEIHAEDINRHSLRSRWISRRRETRVRRYVCEMWSAGNAQRSRQRAFD